MVVNAIVWRMRLPS